MITANQKLTLVTVSISNAEKTVKSTDGHALFEHSTYESTSIIASFGRHAESTERTLPVVECAPIGVLHPYARHTKSDR
jgi:hypothetical protein